MTACALCELPTPDPPVTGESAEGAFCCEGCLQVAGALSDLDDVEQADLAEAPGGTVEREVPEGAAETFLAVDGMHCATCDVFLALRGERIDGIHWVEANYGVETARVVYDPAAIAEDDLPETLSGYGYTVRFREETDRTGVDRDARARQRDTAERLLIGGFCTMLVMPWYVFALYPSYVGIETGLLEVDASTPLTFYFPLVVIGLFSSVVLFYTGYPVLRGAWVSLRTWRPNMDLLVSVAALSAYAYSTVALATGSTHLYYDVSVAVIMVVTLGRYHEGRIRAGATDALSAVTAASVREATRLTEAGRETVPVDALEPGERVVVPPGERVPVDGTVVEGVADVDESVLTGESLPVTKEPGDDVVGGSIVADDALVVAVGEDAESTVDRIATALWEIQSRSPPVQRIADALATIFVPVVLVLGIVVTAWQLATGATVAAAMLAGLTVLVVSCPCAMGLATPLAISGGLRDALGRGLVVTNEAIFEVAPAAEIVVFDKTGTLTAGEMGVADVAGHDATLRRAAAVERFASHPVADAILEAALAESDSDGRVTETDPDGSAVATDGGVSDPSSDGSRTVGKGDALASEPGAGTADQAVPADAVDRQLSEARDFTRHPGEGVSGTVGDDRVIVGTPGLVADRCGPVPGELADRIERIREAGGLPVVVGWDGAVRGVIAVTDRGREHWESALEAFADRRVAVLTGDTGPGAERFREHPAVDDVFAGVPPDGKVETVRRLAATGTTVMVGDGTNDAPALAAADLGIAMGDGTARAMDAADVVAIDGDLGAVEDAFALADGTRRRIRENIGWALLYNAVAIPLAVVGLINPLFAALAMAASSILVVSNSRRPVLRGSDT